MTGRSTWPCKVGGGVLAASEAREFGGNDQVAAASPQDTPQHRTFGDKKNSSQMGKDTAVPELVVVRLAVSLYISDLFRGYRKPVLARLAAASKTSIQHTIIFHA